MSERPTAEDFSKHVGTKFRVLAETTPRPLELELVKVKGYAPLPEGQRPVERFSLFFRGPGDIFMQQGTFTLDHPEMGEQALFIVPVGRDEQGFSYEVVFNYFADGDE
jgi:hypothetical protein